MKAALWAENTVAQHRALVQAALMARVIFHIETKFLTRYRQAAHLAIYPVIEDIIRARGGEILVVERGPRDLPPEARWGDGDLHIVQGGLSRGVGYLNTGVAYLTGYWHLDAQGVLADSSALMHPFDLAQVDRLAATAFARDLAQRFCTPRKSRYRQARKVQPLPKGCIAVFLQGPAPAARGQQYVSQANFVRAAIAAANGRAVVVKAHPLRRELGGALMERLRAEGLSFIEAEPNVHDLLAACAVTISINSAAAIEGFLHGKPAILCGRSDFGSQAEVLRDAADMPAALHSALTSTRDYAPWLHWYFNSFCLDLGAPNIEARILDIFDQAGFGADRLFPSLS
ncbi:MAG: hypothetical protein U5N55_06100 [Cypionkella sp.]|nr:hypothetical protein [Cypionkella sp.]